MLGYLRDRWTTSRLKARYRRLMQERVLNLVETDGPRAVSPDPGEWTLLGGDRHSLDPAERADARSRARRLTAENPHAGNILRLLEAYVVGPDLLLGHTPRNGDIDAETSSLVATADRVWVEFLEAADGHFSYREYARRTWRDGECFLRVFPQVGRAPEVRFIDPEAIAATTADPETEGVVTSADDVESPVAYLQVNASGELVEEIPAERMFHAKIGADSNQKRGVTRFAPLLEALDRFDHWMDVELTARKLQASIVLWRKVQGGPSQALALADGAESSSPVASAFDPSGSYRRERVRAGTILTTSQGTELKYLHPDTNFGDAVPLGRLLLLCTAAGAGLPEFMLTSDASNANFASTMVAEGPAVKLFQAEQAFFRREFTRIWRWVMLDAVGRGVLPESFFEAVKPNWTFPELVSRDRPRERDADAKLVTAGVLSRAEVARRDGADPDQMQQEIAEERKRTTPADGRETPFAQEPKSD